MARNISEIRERRTRSQNPSTLRSTPMVEPDFSEEGQTTSNLPKNTDSTPAKKETIFSKLNPLKKKPKQNNPLKDIVSKSKGANLNNNNPFNIKPKNTKKDKAKENTEDNENKNKKGIFSFLKFSKSKERDLSQGGNFKIGFFILYIIVFLGIILVIFLYIIDRESQYVTINKQLFTVAPKPAVKKEEKTTAPLIEEDQEATPKETDPIKIKINNDKESYRITEITPKNLGTKKLELAEFLDFIKNNRADFCKYVEHTRNSYMLANNELRDYSSTTYPVSNNLMDYTNCMDTNLWKETDLFNLYNNIYDDYLGTEQIEDQGLLTKLTASKNYNMFANFNPVRDMADIYKSKFLSENDFIKTFKGNYINQILFCDYSNKFAKAYDLSVSKRAGSLRPVSNCYAPNVNNQEAYTQYIFYYNYIQPNSSENNAEALQSSFIPNK